MGFFSRVFVRLVEFTVFFFLIVLLPGIPPKGEFTAFTVAPLKPLEGPLALNNLLDNGERLFGGVLHGPEAFVVWKGELYTSTHGGEVVKIVGKNIVHVAQFGKPCEGYHQESICGRPLGMAFTQTGDLIVSETYSGIWKVDITTGKKNQLVSIDNEIDGKKPQLPNSVAVARNGDIYWTDSSTDKTLEDGLYTLLLDPSGRLIHYSAATKKNTVLLDDLWFANGLVLSPNEDFVVVAATAASKLVKYHLKGAKKGQSEVFIDGLPGLPDNLTPLADGILVPLVQGADSTHPAIFQSMAATPLVRKFLARLMGLAEIPLKFLAKTFPNYWTERAAHWMGNFEMASILSPARTSVLYLDWNGQVIASFHGSDKTIHGISHAIPFNGHLYLGSPFNPYLGRVPLPEILNVKVVVQEAPKPKPTEAPKPKPTEAPKPKPTEAPKPKPTEAPKPKPTEAPKPKPTEAPKPKPTEAPKPKPTEAPTPKPTEAPKPKPTETPKPIPTEAPKPKPTEAPKLKPTEAPKPAPAVAPKPSEPAKKKPTAPAPIEEPVLDSTPPTQPPLKVIKRGGDFGEL